jgi:hypothetical protein
VKTPALLELPFGGKRQMTTKRWVKCYHSQKVKKEDECCGEREVGK